jgi:hypothetical protein
MFWYNVSSTVGVLDYFGRPVDARTSDPQKNKLYKSPVKAAIGILQLSLRGSWEWLSHQKSEDMVALKW